MNLVTDSIQSLNPFHDFHWKDLSGFNSSYDSIFRDRKFLNLTMPNTSLIENEIVIFLLIRLLTNCTEELRSASSEKEGTDRTVQPGAQAAERLFSIIDSDMFTV